MERSHKAFKESQVEHTTIKEEEITAIKQEQTDYEENSCDNILQLEIDLKESVSNEECDIQKNPLENVHNSGDWNDKDFDTESESATSDDCELSDYSDSEAILIDGAIKKDKETKIDDKNRKTKRKFYDKSEDRPKKKRSSHRLDPLLTEQLIKKHIKMLCDLCVYSGSIFSDIVTHFKESHPNVQPYIMCCNRKFTRSYCIDQHAIIHENPNSFR